ncbi:MAG: ABC transporter substrate-binding protein, partial [Burkholderiales bacterium]
MKLKIALKLKNALKLNIALKPSLSAQLKKSVTACALAFGVALGGMQPAQAQYSGDVIRIGIITDMSSVYADLDGAAGVEAIRMAIADMGNTINGKKVEVLFADHQ